MTIYSDKGIHTFGGTVLRWDLVKEFKSRTRRFWLVRAGGPSWSGRGVGLVTSKDRGRVVVVDFMRNGDKIDYLCSPETVREYKALVKAVEEANTPLSSPIYRTVYEVVVLSAEPPEYENLYDMARDLDSGDGIGGWWKKQQGPIKTRREYREAMEEVGSEDFFGRLEE